MNITNEIINEIRNKVDIVDIISKYLPLTQRGKNYFGVCPFHDDHSPSMSVSKEKQIFTCFSCGATGNVFTFVADYEHIGFYDAVRLLGNKVGYDLGTSKVTKNKNAEAYQIYDLACRFYQNNLNTIQGKNANLYLENRQIDKETIKKFKIGLSITKTSLTDYLISKGYSLSKLVALGISTENGTDMFTNRIMFPLYDLEGNVIAFSGRIYNTKEGSKYVNTKETAIFKKGNILYNYHNAKDVLKKNKNVIVMEGFMDVIRANTVGITNCIATMGTALTKQNALLLKKMADEIILCFDGDEAGLEATVSAINVFKEIDVVPKVIRLEEELDPDEYILKYGYEKFKSKIDNPKSSIEFLMEQHKNDKNLTNLEDITKYINESLNDLLLIDDDILVSLTLRKLAEEYKIEYDVLNNKYVELKKINDKKRINRKEIKVEEKKVRINKYDLASKNLLFYMLKDKKVINKVAKDVIFFPNDLIRDFANEMIYFYKKYGGFNVADFISYIANDEAKLNLYKEINGMNLHDVYSEEEIEDYINLVNAFPVKKKINDLNKKLKEETNPLEQAKLLKEKMLLKGVKQW